MTQSLRALCGFKRCWDVARHDCGHECCCDPGWGKIGVGQNIFHKIIAEIEPAIGAVLMVGLAQKRKISGAVMVVMDRLAAGALVSAIMVGEYW